MAHSPTVNGSANYFVQSGKQVEAWSTERLQYEPKRWQRAFRKDLRTAIASLVAAPEQVLHGVYISPDKSYCDVENILFYNIGGGSFVKSAGLGLRFERVFDCPPACPVPLANKPLHYHRYSFQKHSSSFKYWREANILAYWKVNLEKVSASNNCSPIWYAIKNSSIDIITNQLSVPKHYGLWALLITPRGKVIRPASTVKVVFDGIIAALQYHNGSRLNDVSRRLSRQLGTNPEKIASLLCSKDRTVLGEMRLVYPRSSGVQWNPRDDDCIVGEFIMQQDRDSKNWELSGELFEIEPVID